MKKVSFILVLAILLAGGAVGTLSTSSYAQVYAYPPPPQNLYANPWVGPNTPWVYYNGDWFLNGVLYYFFGNRYGWAPYYAYAPTYIVRPQVWYAPRWNAWYRGHPTYWKNFYRKYPYWRGHQYGYRYDRNFYEKYHRGQGGGWQKGFHGGPAHPVRPEVRHDRRPEKARPVPQRERPAHGGPQHERPAHGGPQPERPGPGGEGPQH
jgi:hypothetical protein